MCVTNSLMTLQFNMLTVIVTPLRHYRFTIWYSSLIFHSIDNNLQEMSSFFFNIFLLNKKVIHINCHADSYHCGHCRTQWMCRRTCWLRRFSQTANHKPDVDSAILLKKYLFRSFSLIFNVFAFFFYFY